MPQATHNSRNGEPPTQKSHGDNKNVPLFGTDEEEPIWGSSLPQTNNQRTENPAAAIFPAASLNETDFKKYASEFLKATLAGKTTDNTVQTKSEKNLVEVSYQNVSIKRLVNDVQQTITVTGSDNNLANLLSFFKSMAAAKINSSNYQLLIFELTEPKPLTQERLDELLEQIGYTFELQAVVKIQLPQLTPEIKPEAEPASAVEDSRVNSDVSAPTPPPTQAPTQASVAQAPKQAHRVTVTPIPKKENTNSWVPMWMRRKQSPDLSANPRSTGSVPGEIERTNLENVML